ncbi:MAG: endolytic transglycosylase MltG [Myxococcota bacterium]|nr:endolytic transglycosylase MltG [Myxococcota bacterium]
MSGQKSRARRRISSAPKRGTGSGASTPPRRAAKRASGAGRWLWRLLALLGLGVVLPIGLLLYWATRPGPGDGRRVATRIRPDISSAELADELAALGLLDSALLFRIYADYLAPSVAPKPGPHLFETGASPRKLLQRLARLPTRPRVRVNIPEGYTYLQIAERLEKHGVCLGQDFRDSARDAALLGRLGIRGGSAEGYLFPATYELFVDADPEQLITQLATETKKRLDRLDGVTGGSLSRLGTERGWTEREVLTLASIVERESASPDERPRIASVFFNRLDDPSFRPARRLQSDPTAAYGCLVMPEKIPSCAGFRGRATPEMLRDSANPYNTYRNPGLPPGPIANPGEGAVRAVLQPAATDFLYFVLGADGKHRFGRSFEEHRRAIEGGGAAEKH